MEALAERLYRRWPRRFVVLLQALGFAIVLVTIAPPLMVLGPLVFDLSASEMLLLASVLLSLTVVATVVASVWSRSVRGQVNAWARGDQGDPSGVWHAGARFTQVLSARIVLVALVLGVPVNHVVMHE